jgi:glycosyl transferase family WbsX
MTTAPSDRSPVRAIAFYLPQFHPVPENDAWWGRGFTEWHNVRRGRPLFRGHFQPRLPGELGFYDLRNAETRQRQATLAVDHGISAFCYYHYWFQGRRLLERPFDEVLTSGTPDLPFCLCWANEKWTRAWDGTTGEVLVDQSYSEDDDRRHIRWLARAFDDDRYVRVDGRPLFLVYRARNMPDPLATTLTWRAEARTLGLGELFLARVESFPEEHDDPRSIGFDAAVEFQPDGANLPRALRRGEWWERARRLGLGSRAYGANTVFEYADLVEAALAKAIPPYPRFPCATPSWDNSPRRRTGGAWIFRGSTPELYARWLREIVRRAPRAEGDDALVFVNAWNEWAEGNHLEPSARWGRAYLEATRRALRSQRGPISGSGFDRDASTFEREQVVLDRR